MDLYPEVSRSSEISPVGAHCFIALRVVELHRCGFFFFFNTQRQDFLPAKRLQIAFLKYWL